MIICYMNKINCRTLFIIIIYLLITISEAIKIKSNENPQQLSELDKLYHLHTQQKHSQQHQQQQQQQQQSQQQQQQQHLIDDKDPNLKIVYEATRSECYAKGEALQCSPPFTNIAEGLYVNSTSTCGEFNKSEQICKPISNYHHYYSNNNSHRGQRQSYCEPCNNSYKYGSHLLTDPHQMNNETCWYSSQIPPGGMVNLTLSLHKKFEIYYISLRPCGQYLPDSIALYKSSDFGQTWSAWQYFSTDCYRAFRLPTSNEHNVQISLANIQEVLCVALKKSDNYDNHEYGSESNVIAFSTTIGRPSTQPWSAGLIDWMTMTDLKISLIRFPNEPNHIQQDSSGLFLVPNLINSNKLLHLSTNTENNLLSKTGTLGMSRYQHQTNSNSIENDNKQSMVHFSFSDLSIGGRCKCNGHSNRCVRDRILESNGDSQSKIRWGPLRCDCKHNTEGVDCERCAAGYLDRPWARATSESANECKQCQCGNHTTECIFSVKEFKRSGGVSGGICVACQHNTEGPKCDQCITGFTLVTNRSIGHEHMCRGCECNLHSNSCVFSNQIYFLSMKVSGGVCQDCQHNTIGRRCHHCASGYYRDWTKPVSHDQVCLECLCHPIGSFANQPCDRKTGQCPCKPGVVGQSCDRCQEGYKQTSLPDTPCIKATEHYAYRRKEVGPIEHVVKSQPNVVHSTDICPPCEKSIKRIQFKQFCQFDAVFRAEVQSFTIHKDLIHLEVSIQNIWRIKGIARRFLPKKVTPNSKNNYGIWIKLRNQSSGSNSVHCVCPNLKYQQSYLFITRTHQAPYNNRMELMLDADNIILPWHGSWKRRLGRFKNKSAQNMCENRKLTTTTRHVQRLRTMPGYYSSNRKMRNEKPIQTLYHQNIPMRKASRTQFDPNLNRQNVYTLIPNKINPAQSRLISSNYPSQNYANSYGNYYMKP